MGILFAIVEGIGWLGWRCRGLFGSPIGGVRGQECGSGGSGLGVGGEMGSGSERSSMADHNRRMEGYSMWTGRLPKPEKMSWRFSSKTTPSTLEGNEGTLTHKESEYAEWG